MTAAADDPPPSRRPLGKRTSSGSRATPLVNRARATAARTAEPLADATSGQRPASTSGGALRVILVLVTERPPGMDVLAGARREARADRAGSPAIGSARTRPLWTRDAAPRRPAGPGRWPDGRY